MTPGALEVEEGAVSPETQATSQRWKKQGTDSPLEPPERTQPYQHLDYSPV